MTRTLPVAVVSLVTTFVAGCAGGGEDSGADGAPTEPATWEEVRDEVLAPSCGFSSCHAPPGSAQFGVDNTTEESAWIGVESTVQAGSILVVPGDADASYLVQKLEGSSATAGEPMPPPAGGLGAAKIERVRSWIETLE